MPEKKMARKAEAGRTASSTIRRATRHDLPAIQALEAECFQDYRQASAASLRRSLASPRQSVWVVDAEGTSGTTRPGRLWALLVLWHHPKRLRIYDIATHPDARGRGLGGALMAHAEAQARKDKADLLTLEAEELDPRLVTWYEQQGFRTVARLTDYYHEGCSALRMVREVRAGSGAGGGGARRGQKG